MTILYLLLNKSLFIFLLFIQSAAISAWPKVGVVESILSLEENARQAKNQWTVASFEDAIDKYGQAEDEWRKLGLLSKASNCVREIAFIEFYRGHRQIASRRLDSDLQVLSGDKFLVDRIKSKSILALLKIGTSETLMAEKLVDEVLQLARSQTDPSSSGYANFSAGGLYESRRDLVNAKKFYSAAVNQWAIAGDLSRKSYALIELSFIESSGGNPLQGIDYLSMAEEYFETDGNRRGLAFAYIAKGHLYSTIAEKQKALEYYKKALEIFPDDVDSIDKASLMNGMGYVYEGFAEWNLSLTYRKRAIELFRREEHLFGELATLPSLIKLSFGVGDSNAAFSYLAETESLSSKVGDKFWAAVSYKQVGDYHFEKGDDETAVSFYARSLKILKKAGLQIEVGLIFDRLGMIYKRKKDYRRSRRYYEKALKTSQDISHKAAEANTLFNLARLESIEGNNQEALRLANSSIAVTESLFTDIRNVQSRGSYISSVYQRYEFLVGLLMRFEKTAGSDQFALEAFQVSERSKARAMREHLMLAESDFTADADPLLVQKEKEFRTLLNAKSDNLTNLLSQGAEYVEIAAIKDDIAETEHALEDIVGDLKQQSPVYSAIKDTPPFDIADFQNHVLDDDSLLLEFSLGSPESYLWIVSRNDFQYFSLPPKEHIEARVEKLRNLLESRELPIEGLIEDYQNRIADADREYWTEAHRLSNEILGPIAERLNGKRLIIVADGKLHYFPLASLPKPDTENDEPLLITNEIVNAPSASALKLITSRPQRAKQANRDILVFADPIYSETDERLTQRGSRAPNIVSIVVGNFRSIDSLHLLSRLPGSDGEARSIAEVVGKAKVTVRSGFDANRESVLSPEVADYKILHFATHGLIDEDHPELSGLVLSLFDKNSVPQDGGFIRLQDVYGMNLNADLVVLSACDTGVGKEVKGEGLLSLNNAFLQVGAKSVVSSLWKVDDVAARELMTGFYRELTSENTISGSLRQAQINLYNDPRFHSPFYWASFTVQGDVWNRPQVTRDRDDRYLLFTLIPILVIGFILYKKLRRGRISQL